MRLTTGKYFDSSVPFISFGIFFCSSNWDLSYKLPGVVRAAGVAPSGAFPRRSLSRSSTW
jgi:hypothetical protein